VGDELVDIVLAGWKQRDNMGRRHRFGIADRARVDVLLAQGTELFSWPGATSFDTATQADLLGGGLSGSGDFRRVCRPSGLTRSSYMERRRRPLRERQRCGFVGRPPLLRMITRNYQTPGMVKFMGSE